MHYSAYEVIPPLSNMPVLLILAYYIHVYMDSNESTIWFESTSENNPNYNTNC